MLRGGYLNMHELETYDDNYKSQLLEWCQKHNKIITKLTNLSTINHSLNHQQAKPDIINRRRNHHSRHTNTNSCNHFYILIKKNIPSTIVTSISQINRQIPYNGR